jgi:ubiquinone/menaquinone biosynthesis C-methylase UbiE
MDFPKLGSVTNETLRRRSVWDQFDSYVGRGSYHRLRGWLDPEWEYPHFAYARAVDELLKPGMRWLDAGCGHQILENRLLQQEQAMVMRARCAVGCDASLAALRKHRSLQKVVCCSLDALPFADGSFDLVTLSMVVEHLEFPGTALAELGRVVAPSGRMIVYTPNASGYQTALCRLGRRIIPKRWAYRIIRFLEYREPDDVFPTFYRANTRRRLAQLMSSNGLLEEKASLLIDKPLLYSFAPLSVGELVLRRFLRASGCKEFTAGTILGVYRRQTECRRWTFVSPSAPPMPSKPIHEPPKATGPNGHR